jgi:hypothetical protein
MAANHKHVGRIKNTGRRCLVVFRTLPNDAFNCLIIQTESLEPDYHDQLISLVDSAAAQSANEFSEVLARSMFSDGSTMLPSLHVKGLLTKIATDQVEMIPNMQTTILLSELNQAIAEQQGVSIQDLAMRGSVKEAAEVQEIAKVQNIPTSPSELDLGKTTSSSINQEATFNTPEDEARYYRSQADKLAKQAAEMRRKAEELAPTKKRNTVTS